MDGIFRSLLEAPVTQTKQLYALLCVVQRDGYLKLTERIFRRDSVCNAARGVD